MTFLGIWGEKELQKERLGTRTGWMGFMESPFLEIFIAHLENIPVRFI